MLAVLTAAYGAIHIYIYFTYYPASGAYCCMIKCMIKCMSMIRNISMNMNTNIFISGLQLLHTAFNNAIKYNSV